MRALLLVDHGSRSPGAHGQLEELARLVEAELAGAAKEAGAGPVACAHLELGEPTVPRAIAALVAAGARRIVVCPYFLALGRHAGEDLPRLCEAARARHPEVEILLAEPLGAHPLLARLVLLRAAAADQWTK